MSPLTNTTAIPLGWAAHHRPIANSTMNTPCSITRLVEGEQPYPLPPGWTGTETIAEDLRCRVQSLWRENTAVIAGQPTESRQYLITLPIEGTPELKSGEGGDVIIAEGRQYQIKQILHGSVLWEWDLICVDNLTQNEG